MMMKIFKIVSLGIILILSSCTTDNSETPQNSDPVNVMNRPDTIGWPQRTLEDTSVCGCGDFGLYKKIDSLGSNFWFAFETKKDIDPIRNIITLNFPRDTSFFDLFLMDFSSEGHCLAPFCQEIFLNIKPCEKGKRFEILNGDALLFRSEKYSEGNNRMNSKLYYVGAVFHNLVFANEKDTIKIKTLKIPATIVGWTHG